MKKYIWWIVAAIVVVGVIFWFGRNKKKGDTELIVKVAKGDFQVLVAVTGELLAKNFEEIRGPDLRSGVFRTTEFRIQDLVDEGTLVDSGDIVAELDRSNARNSLLDMDEQIDVSENRVETSRLDTTVQLKGLRDNLKNLELAVEEAQMVLEESTYEPPATIRKAEINLDKAKRALEQSKAQYSLREQQYKVSMLSAEIQLERQKRQRELMQEIYNGFTIRAPKKGMVIYRRERNGQKRRVGSSINAFDNIVATLPDLSVMLSKAYVNEIDISKVKRDQEVRIGIDAFPDKKYTGTVISVADIGEQLANTDAKVFEVMIEVNESDPIMRPSMTTSNAIVINTLKDVTFVSIDAIYSQDSIPFVYMTNHTKQVVVLGEANDNEIIVEQGLSPGDRVYVSTPENSATWKMVGEELIPVIKQRELEKKQEQEERDRRAAEQERRRPRRQGLNPYDGSGGGGQGGDPRQGGQQRPGQQGGGQQGGGQRGGDGGGQFQGGGQQGGGQFQGGGGGGQRGGGGGR
jgi:multidrug resistance efflux pump